jgi:hypothetical protein
MAGTEHGEQFTRRRFITRHDVEDAAASGQPVRLQGRDVITSEAAQRAADLDVRIDRDKAVKGAPGSSRSPGPSLRRDPAVPVPPAAATPVVSEADLRRAVRAAVVAELGSEPVQLDAVIDRVLKARSK